jgi:hypothetical protein
MLGTVVHDVLVIIVQIVCPMYEMKNVLNSGYL